MRRFGLPGLPNNQPLKRVQSDCRAILGESAERGLDECVQGLAGVVGSLICELQPARGDTGGGEQGESFELAARDHRLARAPTPDLFEHALEGRLRGVGGLLSGASDSRQTGDLPDDGPHEGVEEGLGPRSHVLAVLLGAPADDLLDAVGLARNGQDDGVVSRELAQEELGLGQRAPQQTGVDAPLLAPAPNICDPGLQMEGDPPAEDLGRLIAPLPESNDVAPAGMDLLDWRSRAVGGRGGRRIVRRRGRGGCHDRGAQQERGQTSAERDQGEGGHAGSLQVDPPVKEGRRRPAVRPEH